VGKESDFFAGFAQGGDDVVGSVGGILSSAGEADFAGVGGEGGGSLGEEDVDGGGVGVLGVSGIGLGGWRSFE